MLIFQTSPGASYLSTLALVTPQKNPKPPPLLETVALTKPSVRLVIDIRPLHCASFLFGCQRELLSGPPQPLKTTHCPTLRPRSDMTDLGVNPLQPTLRPLLQAMGFSLTAALWETQ